MARKVVGIAGIGLWLGLIILVIGLQTKANGSEQMFENLPEGWKVENSLLMSNEQKAAFSNKLGGEISKLTNMILSFKGQQLQVNVLYCPSGEQAEKIHRAVLEAHNGIADLVLIDANMVVEFTRCEDIRLARQARQALGLEIARLDNVARKMIKKIPAGWKVIDSFIVPQEQTNIIGDKLNGRIKKLSNTILAVQGRRFQVNVFESMTPQDAERIHESILKMKKDPAFCPRFENFIVEFVSDDVELAKKSIYALGIKPMPIETLAKDLVDSLASGDYDKAVENFNDTMKKALPAEKLQEAWKSLIVQFGSFVEQGGTRRAKVMQYDIIFVTCKFKMGVLDAKVVFDSNKQIAGLFFVPVQVSVSEKPADLVSSDAFSEKEIWVGTGQMALPGTLTLPKGQGPFPVVLLVHGSGPQDRDETIGPNKPFRDLAYGLASRGIAVLRYEKRTKAFPTQMAAIINTLTVKEEVIEDVLSAAALLRETNQIDPNKVFVLGHSLGGYVVPRIGKLDSRIAGFIIMAGTARPLEDVVVEQLTYIFSLDGVITDTEKTSLEQLKGQASRVKDPSLSPKTPAADLPLGVPAAYWLDLRGYQPAEMAKELTCPMLILQGGRDYQVTDDDFQLWKKALSSRKNVEFKFYAELNHLFMEGQGKSTPAEYERAGNVSEAVIGEIAMWIKR